MKNVFEDYCGEGSTFQTFLTLVRYPLGIAIFLLPWAFKFGGIIGGPVVIAIVVIVNAYRGHVLTKVAAELKSNGITSPTGCSDWWVLENSFGKISRTSVNCFLVIFSTMQWLALLGHATTFLAFAGLSLNQAFPRTEWPGISGDRYYIGICMGVVIVVHALAQCYRNLMHNACAKCIFPCLCSAFLLVLLPAICATFVALPTIMTFTGRLATNMHPLSPSTDMEWEHLALMVAAILFINGATPDDVTATYGTLRNQLLFPFILIIGSVLVIAIGVGFSTAVFLGLDGLTCGSVTFNLPLAGDFSFIRTLSSILALIFVSFRHQIDPSLSSRLTTAEIVCDIAFKIIFLAIAGALAIGIPSFAGLACLFGALTSFNLTLTFPFLCDLLLHLTGGRTPSDDNIEVADEGEGTSLTRGLIERVEKPKSFMRIIRDVIFILIGLVGMIAGLIAAIEFLQLKGRGSGVDGCEWTEANVTSVAIH